MTNPISILSQLGNRLCLYALNNKENVKRYARFVIAGLIFLCVTHWSGMDMREAQQMHFSLAVILLFSLIIDNIWITAFLWWTVLSYYLFGFEVGRIYVSNVFFGCVLYYVTKVVFRKEHLRFYINGLLWLVAANVVLMVMQLCGYDFIYKLGLFTSEGFKGYTECNDPAGFMGYKGCMGIVMAMGVGILASKPGRWGIPMALGLFVPLYLSQSSVAVGAAVIVMMWALWYRLRKAVWSAICGIMILGAVLYVWKVDMPMGMMGTRTAQWKTVLRDCMVHPVIGWGMDSFRQPTSTKKHVYAMNPKVNKEGNIHIDYWDNAHNLFVQIFFEYGFIGLFILIAYLRQCTVWFQKAVKTPEVLALGGVLVVAVLTSIAQFPMFLARTTCFIIPAVALFEVAIRSEQ